MFVDIVGLNIKLYDTVNFSGTLRFHVENEDGTIGEEVSSLTISPSLVSRTKDYEFNTLATTSLCVIDTANFKATLKINALKNTKQTNNSLTNLPDLTQYKKITSFNEIPYTAYYGYTIRLFNSQGDELKISGGSNNLVYSSTANSRFNKSLTSDGLRRFRNYQRYWDWVRVYFLSDKDNNSTISSSSWSLRLIEIDYLDTGNDLINNIFKNTWGNEDFPLRRHTAWKILYDNLGGATMINTCVIFYHEIIVIKFITIFISVYIVGNCFQLNF